MMIGTASSSEVLVYSDPSITMMLVGIVIGAIFAGIGLLTGKKGGKKS